MVNDILLDIKGLHASVGEKEILKGVDLTIKKGEIHAVMGPNGAGKSTLSSVLTGKPLYTVTSGSVTFMGKDLLEWLRKSVRGPESSCHSSILLKSPGSPSPIS